LKTTSTTSVFAVGISNYAAESLHLNYAAHNASELVAALGLEAGCAIPQDHLELLTDAEASGRAILDKLTTISSGCSDDDLFIFFFSGHGERTHNEFFLLPVGADPADLKNTAITTSDLRTALTQCRARGLLVILDCCRGAGFAESADRFFMTLGGNGFRLLLTASRADQPSFEFTSQKGTLFSKRLIEVLRGEVPLGEQPGVIYFTELFTYLSRKVAEDLKRSGNRGTLRNRRSQGRMRETRDCLSFDRSPWTELRRRRPAIRGDLYVEHCAGV